ncbi:ATP-binding cassette domain-containing protein [Lactobacillus gasseri]|jgi:ATPase component of ABC transporter with duplicated ATPase domain|nr:ATP-binding cassette domain-containing protein [Lactobacillus gasseri]MCZ3582105.1 ATP-binding cassette domain-containing protein [Lactobacillus gasseri]MCZ3583892.1 ATP-binding cassette domain-containing protein [Lactobacillus gasseri]MCZ3587504.1 ATP-binding cassette domain-containing protein [Lactobacillus gasseri]MCZ3593246.1 ATP-binding cassette domain-containing protein [Lactobacillus gasseri]
MSNIKISNLSFKYSDSIENIFNNLNLDLDSSWKLGLVGRNGRGKTTFLNLLQVKLQGTGAIQSKLEFNYFPLNVKNKEQLTLYALEEHVQFDQWELERELNLMQVDTNLIWQPFNTLSGGEQTKVLLALSFINKDAFPLIDEPTNHLDEKSRIQVVRYLQKHSQGYIVVSHDRDFLNQITNHILAIEHTEIHLYQGNYASYEDTKEKRDKFNQEKNEKLRGQIKALNESRQRIKGYSLQSENNKKASAHKNEIHADINKGFFGHKAAKIMKRSKNIERRMDKDIQDRKGLMTNVESVPELEMNFQPNYHSTLLETRHLDLKVKDKKLFKDLNLIIRNRGIVSLEGKNGAGKSTFLKSILNKSTDVTYQGILNLTNGLRVSYLPQDFVEYSGTLAEFSQKEHLSYEKILNVLRKMGFPRSSFETRIEEMSIGQQKRVSIAKSLVEEADFYLWDEPANYLDVFNQDQLIDVLRKTKPAMLLVEHDEYFISQVASKRIELKIVD